MNIRTLSRREAWMSDAEWKLALRHRRAVMKDFEARNLALSMPLALRIHHYLVTLILTQRAEQALIHIPAEGAPANTPAAEELQGIFACHNRLHALLDEIESLAQPAPAQEEKPADAACSAEAQAQDNPKPEVQAQPTAKPSSASKVHTPPPTERPKHRLLQSPYYVPNKGWVEQEEVYV